MNLQYNYFFSPSKYVLNIYVDRIFMLTCIFHLFSTFSTAKKWFLPGRESNPGLPRDRRRYSPLYYRGYICSKSNTFMLIYLAAYSPSYQSNDHYQIWIGLILYYRTVSAHLSTSLTKTLTLYDTNYTQHIS